MRPPVNDRSLTHPAAREQVLVVKIQKKVCIPLPSSLLKSGKLGHKADGGISLRPGRDPPVRGCRAPPTQSMSSLSSQSEWVSWARSRFRPPGDKRFPTPRGGKRKVSSRQRGRRQAMTRWSSPRSREGTRCGSFPFSEYRCVQSIPLHVLIN